MSKMILTRTVDKDDLHFNNQMSQICIEIEDSVTVHQMMQNFKLFMLACGYSKELLDEYIEDE